MPQVILVTGGSRGLGAATARLLGRGGHAVGVNYVRDESKAQQVVGDVEAAGGRAIAVRADVSDERAVEAMFETVEDSLGPLDGLVNSAGITGRKCDVADVDAETLRQVLEINVIGTYLCAREAVRRMALSRGGRGGAIVNLSSVASVLGSPHEFVHYAASKGAIDSFTTGLGREVAKDGIRVNAVQPGLIDTDMNHQRVDPNRLERLAPSVPIGRAGQPEEVAEVIVWLLSDAASYLAGERITVSGGR